MGWERHFLDVRVVVLGDVCLDRYVEGDVTRVSLEAPVPVLSISSTRPVPGCAANVAANIAGLGGSVELVGVTGFDSEADELSACLRRESSAIRFFS